MSSVPVFPTECVYGILGELAAQLDAPMGYAYPALVTAAGLFVRPTDTVLCSLYTVLLGPTSSGKGQTTKRALKALRVPEDCLITATPNSDRGLATILGSDKDNPRQREVLLVWDEMAKVLQKANIEGSSLPWELNTLFTEDRCGGADKKGKAIVENARISILGNLPVSTPDDFAQFFGQQALGGLSDRFILAAPEKPFIYQPIEIQPASIRFSNPRIPVEYFARMNTWVAKAPETRGKRLGEIMLRVALITASANGDEAVSEQSFWVAQKFVEWQEEIRKIYRPSDSKNHSGEITAIILEAVENIKAGTTATEEFAGKLWVHPPSLFTNRRLYKKYGAPSCQSCVGALAQSRGVSWVRMGKSEKLLLGPESYGIFGTKAEDSGAL